MAMLNFSAASVAPLDSYEALPAGWYNVRVINSEMKPTKDGQNQYLRLTLQVIDGQHANRQLFDNLNLLHSNPVASEIAYRKLSSYCHATGVMQVQDSQQLHGIPIKARVSVRAADGQYDASNDIKEVKNINDGAGATQQGFQPQQQQGFQPQQGFQQPQQGFQQQGFQQQGFQPPQQPMGQMQQPAPQMQPQQQPTGQAVQQAPFQQPAPNAAAQQQSAATQGNQSSATTATTSPSNPPWQQAQAQQQQAPQPAQQQQGGAVPPWAQ